MLGVVCKTHNQEMEDVIMKALVLLLVLGISACESGCEVRGLWNSFKEIATAKTDHYDCGDGGTMYKNNTAQAQTVSFDIKNDCEFTAWLYTSNANGEIVRTRNIHGYSSLSDNAGVEAGGELYLQCTLVETVENNGCDTSYTILGTK